jgi:hypothetical protein
VIRIYFIALSVFLLCCSVGFGATIVVKQDGTGDYTSIQAALDADTTMTYDVIEVRDNCSYAGNLLFPISKVLTVQSGGGFTPAITVTIPDPNYIGIRFNTGGSKIKGFKIGLSATPLKAPYIVEGAGGLSSVEDCNITGPADPDMCKATHNVSVRNTAIKNMNCGVVFDTDSYNANGNVVQSCTFINNKLGVYVDNSTVGINNCMFLQCKTGVTGTNINTNINMTSSTINGGTVAETVGINAREGRFTGNQLTIIGGLGVSIGIQDTNAVMNIDNSTITGCAGYGFYNAGVNSDVMLRNSTITGVPTVFVSGKGTGVRVAKGKFTGENIIVQDCNGRGVNSVNTATLVKLNNSTIQRTGGEGIAAYNNTELTDCVVQNVSVLKTGVYVAWTAATGALPEVVPNVKLLRCTIQNAGKNGLYTGNKVNVDVNECLIQDSAKQNVYVYGNNAAGAVVKIAHSKILRGGANGNRNVEMPGAGHTLEITDSIIAGQKSSDEFWQTGTDSTLKLTRCVVQAGFSRALAIQGVSPKAILNYCNLAAADSSLSPALAISSSESDANITLVNSIITGSTGIARAGTLGIIHHSWNNLYCSVAPYGANTSAGVNEILTNPQYCQTTDANLYTYFAVSLTSPAATSDPDGDSLGARGTAAFGDLNGDKKVNMQDFAMFGTKWFNSNIIPASLPDNVIDNFESYADTATLLTNWSVRDPILQPSAMDLLIGGDSTHSGTKAMRWTYNTYNFNNYYGFCEIVYQLPTGVDLSKYDYFKVWLKRISGANWGKVIYVKFIVDSPISDPYNIGAMSVTDANNPAGEWDQWSVNLHKLEYTATGGGRNFTNLSQLTNVTAILFRVDSSSNTSQPDGAGIMDFDDITLVDTDTCTEAVQYDFNSDCKVDFVDLSLFVNDWVWIE